MIERSPANTARIILDAVRAEFQAAEVALPLRQYLAIGGRGETVHDCEQVTVSWEMTYSGQAGQPSQTPQSCDNMPLAATYFVELVRKYPVTKTGQAVNQDLLTAYAEERMDDSVLLADAGKRAIAGVWLERGLIDIVAGPPQGEYQALILTVITAV